MSTSLVPGTLLTRQSPILARPDVIVFLFTSLLNLSLPSSYLTRSALSPHPPLLSFALLTSPHSHSSCPRLAQFSELQLFVLLSRPRLDNRAMRAWVWPPPDQNLTAAHFRPTLHIHLCNRAFITFPVPFFSSERNAPFLSRHT
jgi:hypothetical protein